MRRSSGCGDLPGVTVPKPAAMEAPRTRKTPGRQWQPATHKAAKADNPARPATMGKNSCALRAGIQEWDRSDQVPPSGPDNWLRRATMLSIVLWSLACPWPRRVPDIMK